MATTSSTRTFTERERENRDAWISSRIANECEGCEEIYHTDGDSSWRPAECCPIHGVAADSWWADLNRELDRRWPGTWVA